MNILMLTNIYPHPDETTKNRTKVIAYFTREWAKQGHNVVVVVNSNRFPILVQKIGELFSKQIFSAKFLEIPDKFWGSEFSYKDGDIDVYNIPITKLLPGANYSERAYSKHLKETINILERIDFIPDVITGHWINPQLRLIAELKERYPTARTAFVFHGDYNKTSYDSSGAQRYLTKIDHVGFRSRSALNNALKYMNIAEAFVCSSGVPKDYVAVAAANDNSTLGTGSLNFITAGRLVKSKNIDCVIDAYKGISDQLSVKDVLTVAGEGPMLDALKQKVEQYKITDKVHVLGRIPRDELQSQMQKSRVFALISDNETFGLVYLEAMLQGCIVIASRYGGVDGIIQDGVNGFLCEQGNKQELETIFQHIIDMTIEQRDAIAIEAKKTAIKYTDEAVAENYLNTIKM